MAEFVRSVKVVVEVDTNKRTERIEFDDLADAHDWLAEAIILGLPVFGRNG